MLTIRGYLVFHHGMMEKPQRQGRTSTGVVSILSPVLTQAWARAGNMKLLTSPHLQIPWTDDRTHPQLSQQVEPTN